MATARELLAQESFEDVKLLVWDCVHKFHRKYGDLYGTREELFSEGCYGYTLAYNRYDHEKGTFPTYVRNMVNFKLMELLRTETKHRVRYNAVEDIETADRVHPFSLMEFLEEVSEDARAIVSLVLDTPRDLQRVVHKEGRKDVKYTLRQYLDGMGWEEERVENAFSEISTALC